MGDPAAILVAARDEQGRVGATVGALRSRFPGVEVIVADDGSRDGTAAEAAAAGATVLRLPRRGKGQALTAAERAAPPGPLLLCDADLRGDPAPLLGSAADVAIAVFAEQSGGGFGLAKGAARLLLRAATGLTLREPLSGQRALSAAGRAACFPLAAGFGCEAWGTAAAATAGLRVEEIELPLRHRATGRDLGGFLHRGWQLADLLLALGPTAVSHRGLRLPLVGWLVGAAYPEVAAVAALGVVDDVLGGDERGIRRHLRAVRTTGTLKAVGIAAAGLVATRRLSGALLVALAANAVNQLDTRPGRALKAYALAAIAVRAPLLPAVLLAPYDLREKTMLGDGGSNALGALLGLRSVERFHGRSRAAAIGALVALNLLGELRSLGAIVEATPVLRALDRIGRQP